MKKEIKTVNEMNEAELLNHYDIVIQYLKQYVTILIEKKINEIKKHENNGKA